MTRTHTVTSGALTQVRQEDAAFTGRVGLSYLFDGGLAPSVSYATSLLRHQPSADGRGVRSGRERNEPVRQNQCDGLHRGDRLLLRQSPNDAGHAAISPVRISISRHIGGKADPQCLRRIMGLRANATLHALRQGGGADGDPWRDVPVLHPADREAFSDAEAGDFADALVPTALRGAPSRYLFAQDGT